MSEGIHYASGRRGVGTQALKGPYRSSGVIRVYRLETKTNWLLRFRHEYLNKQLEGAGITVSLPEDDCVYLVDHDFNEVEHEKEGLVLQDRSIQFQIPVDVSLGKDIAGEETTLKLSIPVFSFSAFMENVITSNELRGPNMLYGSIEPQESLGLDDFAADADAKVVSDLRVLSTPKNKEKKKLVRRPLLRLRNSRPEFLEHQTDIDVGEIFYEGYKVNDVGERVRPLDYLTNLFAFKQFALNSAGPTACYQAIELIQRDFVEGTFGDARLIGGVRANETDFLKAHWDITDECLDERDRTRLERCKLYIDYTSDMKNIVRQLGIYTPGVFRAREAVPGWRRRRYYEVRPSAYMKIDIRRQGLEGYALNEQLGETLCYRNSTVGKSNGWNFKAGFSDSIPKYL